MRIRSSVLVMMLALLGAGKASAWPADAGVWLLGQQGTEIAQSALVPEWTVVAQAGAAPLRIRVVNYYAPAGTLGATTEEGPHSVPTVWGESDVTLQPWESRTLYYRLDAGTPCKRQQIDLLVNGDNAGWLLVQASPNCPPPPPPVGHVCPATTAEAFSWGPEFTSDGKDTIASFTVQPGPPVLLSAAAYWRLNNYEKFPQYLYAADVQIFQGGETYRWKLPIPRCQAQMDLFTCGAPPAVYDEANHAEWDAKALGWWWNTIDCGTPTR